MSKILEKLDSPKYVDQFNLSKEKADIAMTGRGLADYVELLEITEDELDDPDSLILDLGSGMEQNFAKDIRELNLRSKVVSLDPKLGLDENEDLESSVTPYKDSDREARIRGRKNPEPKTLAGLSTSLPFQDRTFTRIYAVYSAPYYLRHPEDIKNTLKEMIRVIKPGGVIRAFPIEEEQLEIVETFFQTLGNVSFSIKKVATADKKDYGNLLTITKK